MGLPDYTRPPHDPNDGRDPSISKHYSTLKATPVDEDTDAIDSDRVPYEDLQVSPNGCTGRFGATYDEGVLDVCSHEGHTPHVRAHIKIRNRIKTDGTRETVVALALPIQEEHGDGNT